MQRYKKICIFLLTLTVICAPALAGCAQRSGPGKSLQEQVGAGPDAEKAFLTNNFDGWRAEWEWWHVYEDPQLDRLMSVAMKNNADFAKSAIRINRALYQAELVGADLLPSFSGDTPASARRNLKTGDPSVRSFGGELAVSYEVDLWRRLRDMTDAQEWEYHATREDWLAARLALVNNAMDAYFLLGYLEGALRVTRQTMENYNTIADLVRVKFRHGKVDGLEPAQAAQAYLAAKNNLIDLQRQQKETEQTLRDLLNLRPGDPFYAPDYDPARADPGTGDVESGSIAVDSGTSAAVPDMKAADLEIDAGASTDNHAPPAEQAAADFAPAAAGSGSAVVNPGMQTADRGSAAGERDGIIDPTRLPRPDLLEVRIPDPDLNVPFAVLFARPDLRAAEDRLQKAVKTLSAADKSWYPSISLGASLSSSSDKARTAFDVPFSAGMVTVRLPFLDWNRLRWETKITEADFETAKLDFEQSVTTALNEVDAAKFKVTAYKDTLQTTQEKYAYDVRISAYYKERYDAGASELSDWLGALNTEASSRLALLQARYALIQQENALYKALGGRYVYAP